MAVRRSEYCRFSAIHLCKPDPLGWSLAIDIGDFEIKSFVKPQAAGVDGGKIDVVVESFNVGQNVSDFFDTQDGRQAVFVLGAQDRENVPIALQDVDVEKANPAVADAHGLGRPVIDVFPVEEILLEFGLRNQIWGFGIELREHAHRASVGLLGSFSFPIELQSSDHPLIPIVHDKSSPSVKVRRAFYRRTMTME